MGTCVSRCCPCSSPPSTIGDGDDSLSSYGGGSPTLSRHQTAKHAVAVHPLPIASSSPTPIAASTSTSSSLLSPASSSLLSSASSSVSMATTTSSSSTATRSSSSSRPSSAEFLKVRTCRDMDMEVVVLDPGKKKKKLSRPASAVPRQSSSPRTPPALSAVRSPRKKKPSTTTSSSNGRRIRTTAPTMVSARRVRPLPPRAPPAGARAGARAWAGGSASCRKDRLPSSSSYRPADSGGRRKSTGATVATAGIGVGGGELLDDLNNPLMSMDCFIFL